MRRRELITLLGGAAVARPLAVRAQQAEKVSRVGWLSPDARPPPAFSRAMRDLGYIEGQNFTVEQRLAEGILDRLPDLAVELVRRNIDLIVVNGYPAVLAARQATARLPIIFATHVDAVETRLVRSLASPSGNATGFTMLSAVLAGKRLQLLKEISPDTSRVAVLVNTANPGFEPTLQQLEDAARLLHLKLQIVQVRISSEFNKIRPAVDAAGTTAIYVSLDPLFLQNRIRIAEILAEVRLPALYDLREFAEAGGLVSYGPIYSEIWRGVATYVDKIFKGAKPSDLPVQEPAKFELVVNMKTAKALGLTIPQSIFARADEVIE